MTLLIAAPSEFHLLAARADFNTDTFPKGRNIRAGTAIFKYQFLQGIFLCCKALYFLCLFF